jgi:hypothetical protein
LNSVELLFTAQEEEGTVGYAFAFEQSQPWSVTPNVADLDALRTTILSLSATTTPQETPSIQPQRLTCVALVPSKFSPEMRVVGDVSFNIDVLLNWLGIASGSVVPELLIVNLGIPLASSIDAINAAVFSRLE